MRKINIITIAITLLALSSCRDNQKAPKPNSQDQRTVNEINVDGTTTTTPHCYILFDDDQNFDNRFGFLLADARIDVNIPHGLETTMTSAAVLWHTFGGTVADETQVPVAIGTYVLNMESESVAFKTINAWKNIPYTLNNIVYDHFDDNFGDSVINNVLGGSSMTINSFSINHTTRTGVVDLSYSIIDSNNRTSTGTYSGNFTIVNLD